MVEVVPLKQFWPAESYHKDYYEHHKDEGYCRLVIKPKIEVVIKITEGRGSGH